MKISYVGQPAHLVSISTAKPRPADHGRRRPLSWGAQALAALALIGPYGTVRASSSSGSNILPYATFTAGERSYTLGLVGYGCIPQGVSLASTCYRVAGAAATYGDILFRCNKTGAVHESAAVTTTQMISSSATPGGEVLFTDLRDATDNLQKCINGNLTSSVPIAMASGGSASIDRPTGTFYAGLVLGAAIVCSS